MILFITIMSTILIALFVVLWVMLDCRKEPKLRKEKVTYGIGATILGFIISFVIYVIIRTLVEGNILW